MKNSCEEVRAKINDCKEIIDCEEINICKEVKNFEGERNFYSYGEIKEGETIKDCDEKKKNC